MGKNKCIFLAVTFNYDTAFFSHETFVYQILQLRSLEFSASYVRGPGFKFQYGVWLS
jgi:hypothetical protein